FAASPSYTRQPTRSALFFLPAWTLWSWAASSSRSDAPVTAVALTLHRTRWALAPHKPFPWELLRQMIFNTWDYFLLFLLPAAVLFRSARPNARPWILAGSGCLFFVYFSYTQLGGAIGAACLLIFLWESFVSRFYKPGSWICLLGVTQTILFLAVFKY